MSRFEPISNSVLAQLTDIHHERNIYAHPNALARGIFWQRLKYGYRLLEKHALDVSSVLDFGGGSGAFLPSLAGRFREVTVIDTDLDDARRIMLHYQLNNVRLISQDITMWDSNNVYDLIVATDVLEHFADMIVPQRFFERHLKSDGLLLVSLPTENSLYEIGRALVRKEKPHDHYHSAHTLVQFYRNHGYVLLEHGFVPRLAGFSLPLFHIGVFRKPA